MSHEDSEDGVGRKDVAGGVGRGREAAAAGLAGLLLGVVFGANGLGAQQAEAPAGASDDTGVPSAACPDSVTEDAGVWIVGRVTDAASGVPLPGATVSLTWEEGERLREITTGVRGDGVYHFCGAPAGMHLTLRATAAGRSGGMQALDVPLDELAIRQDLEVLLSDDRQGRVVGRVLDSDTGRGIEAATVRLQPGGVEAVTGYDGRFSISGVPVGEHDLRIHHVAYGEHTAGVEVLEDRTADVLIEVAQRAVEMEPLDVEVTVEQRYRSLERRGFYERMHWAEAHGGEFLPPDLIQRRKAGKMSHLLQTVPGVEVYRTCPGTSCAVLPVIRGCGRVGSASHKGVPAVFVDGVRYRMNLAGNLGKGIDELSVSNVRAMEIYESPAQTPAEFYDLEHHCAIVIWTKSGPDRR